jgi:hypothetical protein
MVSAEVCVHRSVFPSAGSRLSWLFAIRPAAPARLSTMYGRPCLRQASASWRAVVSSVPPAG